MKSHTVTDLRINLVSPGGQWTLTAFGTNITDQHYFLEKNLTPNAAALGGTSAITGAGLMRGFMGAPEEYGVKISMKF